MYWKHSNERLPEDMDAPIWRYMDFTKFVYMLDTQSLFFCRPDCLSDRFEGTWGAASLKSIEQDLRQKVLDGMTVVGGVDDQMKGIRPIAAHMRRVTAVNCWHQNAHESEAMWRLYMSSFQGIAIRSTTSRLINSFSNDKTISIHVGLVSYIDYEKESIPFGNYLSPFLYKRKSFEHEKELRAVAYKVEISDEEDSLSIRLTQTPFVKPGEDVSVNLPTLIESVHLAPGSPAWIERTVASATDRYGLNVPVLRSRMDELPD